MKEGGVKGVKVKEYAAQLRSIMGSNHTPNIYECESLSNTCFKEECD